MVPLPLLLRSAASPLVDDVAVEEADEVGLERQTTRPPHWCLISLSLRPLPPVFRGSVVCDRLGKYDDEKEKMPSRFLSVVGIWE